MEKDWRWFGRKDKITLPMLRQIGVEGIVTALHDMPIGEVWTVDRISELKDYIESYGLRWSVVESLPVSEVIKCAGPERDVLIENYCNSLTNLGKCGIRTVCYNFMPVIDWIRTDLEYPCPDGSTSLYFDMAEFAYFDIHILRREGAEADYSANILKRVEALASRFTPKDRERLIDTIIVKTQGFVNGNFADPGFDPVGLFREMLKPFAGISKTTSATISATSSRPSCRSAKSTESTSASIPTIPPCLCWASRA